MKKNIHELNDKINEYINNIDLLYNEKISLINNINNNMK